MMGLAPAKPLRQPLARLLAGFDVGDVPDAEIAQVTVDSRAARPGSLFMAYQGTRAHGLDHADDAVARGASAVIWDRERAPALDVPHVRVPDLAARASRIAARAYGEPAQRLFVTGVTGTDGKTSCAWLLARALDALGTRCGYLGTLGFGFTDDLAEANHTTPDAVAVQDWLARFVAALPAGAAVYAALTYDGRESWSPAPPHEAQGLAAQTSTGLGMALVQALVRSDGGEVE